MKLFARIARGLSNRTQNLRKIERTVACERLEERQLFSTYMVTSLSDAGIGSLRNAVALANVLPGADTIDFKSGLAGTITLTSGQLMVTNSVTIVGPGINKLSVSGNNHSRIFYLSSTTSKVSISGLTITKGLAAPGFGGGIESFANLTLGNMNFTQNVAGSHATAGKIGGGGGALMNYGSATIDNSTFDGNVTNSTDNANYGGGAIFNAGSMKITRSTISHNKAQVEANTLLGESALAGVGGIYNGGNLIAENDTIAYNNAGGSFTAGLYNAKTAFVLNCTIARNTGGFGAAGLGSEGTLTLGNTIIAQNTISHFGGAEPDLAFYGTTFTFDNDGYNLFGVAPAVSTDATNLKGTMTHPLDPKLGLLASNGGPTMTLAIGQNSPAFNKGSNIQSEFFGLITDQRGLPRIQNGVVDIGAYE